MSSSPSLGGRRSSLTGHRSPRTGRLGLAVLVATTLAVGITAAPAHAVPPPNDAPAQAIEVIPFTAENGTSADRYGVADLSEATPDAGVPRCLGTGSFQRTAWFRVPGGPQQRLRLDASLTSGQPDEAAELAAFVQPSGAGASTPSTLEPQACDGRQTGSTDAGVELTVPAGRDVLVQVALPAGSRASSVILSVDTDQLRQLAPPLGDDALDRVKIRVAKARKIRLRGATITEEDPAQPACPSAGTVWRRAVIKQTGEQVLSTRGKDVSSLTAFVGKRPSGGNVRACATATKTGNEVLAVPFRARKGDVAWLRLGTDTQTAATTTTAFSGPCDQTPLAPLSRPKLSVTPGKGQARRKRSIKLRLRADGPCLSQARVTVRRGKTIVAQRVYANVVRGTTTLTVPRLRKVGAPRGTYRVSIAGRVPKGKRKTFGTTKTLRLR